MATLPGRPALDPLTGARRMGWLTSMGNAMLKPAGSLALLPPRILLALGTVSLVLAASVGPSSAATDRPGAVSAITLVERRVIDIADSQMLALSPDGSSIVVTRPAGPEPDELCIHDVATLAEHVCTELGALDARLWADSVVWSPDSQWLVFAELWPQYFADGDLWLLDASTGALTNLLDDGYSGTLGSTSAVKSTWEGVITLPMYPAFTPDSAAVTFSRTLFEADEFKSMDIATVPITGGDAARLGDSEREFPGAQYWRMLWSADGSGLYVSLVDYQASGLGSDSGIWVFGGEGEHARQLLSVTGPDDWPPSIVAVSPRGEHLLVGYPTHRGAPSYALVDGVNGDVERIETLRPNARRSTPISGVMLSPDGSLLITISGSRGRQVAVRDVATSNETVLAWEPSGAAPSDLAGEVLTWAQSDTILVTGGRRDRSTLIVLDRGS